MTIRVYGSLLFPLLSLIIDYISDFAFINALVNDFPLDSQFIHLSKPAIAAMVIYEIFAIVAFPLTAVTLLIWLNTREGFYEDIQQKMLISSIAYLLDDGPETLLQYYFVDKFSGTDYSYPDNFRTSQNSAILMSSIVTFGLALFSFVRLTLRYKDLICQQISDGFKFGKKEILMLAKYFFITVIPLAISCLRVIATKNQLDARKSYLPGCLEYSVEQSVNNSYIATVDQPGLFKFDCWIGIDYFLVFGSFFGMFSNLLFIIWYFRN
ncbi:unnamed protein product [Oikopleura dioica]|uniref:Uncharacterized protein n=1 Tax=Oikopleura dioica TaxID=34765 RepID=E4X197_OIKDI|nr:unnamed protein product [Oikopleura dioica]